MKLQVPPISRDGCPVPRWGLTQKREGVGRDDEELEALTGPGYDRIEEKAEENGQHEQGRPILDDEDDLNGEGGLSQGRAGQAGAKPLGSMKGTC